MCYDNHIHVNKILRTGHHNGGWWFNTCYTACLTCGPWKDSAVKIWDAIIYNPFTEDNIAIKDAEMKIKLPY